MPPSSHSSRGSTVLYSVASNHVNRHCCHIPLSVSSKLPPSRSRAIINPPCTSSTQRGSQKGQSVLQQSVAVNRNQFIYARCAFISLSRWPCSSIHSKKLIASSSLRSVSNCSADWLRQRRSRRAAVNSHPMHHRLCRLHEAVRRDDFNHLPRNAPANAAPPSNRPPRAPPSPDGKSARQNYKCCPPTPRQPNSQPSSNSSSHPKSISGALIHFQNTPQLFAIRIGIFHPRKSRHLIRRAPHEAPPCQLSRRSSPGCHKNKTASPEPAP